MEGPIYIVKQKDQKVMAKQQGWPAPTHMALGSTAPLALLCPMGPQARLLPQSRVPEIMQGLYSPSKKVFLAGNWSACMYGGT